MDDSKRCEIPPRREGELTNVKYYHSFDLPRTMQLDELIRENTTMSSKVEGEININEFEFSRPMKSYADEVFDFNRRAEEERRLKESINKLD